MRKRKVKRRRVRTRSDVVVNYAERNEILAEIGFASYGAYLASDLWKSIRIEVFRLKGQRCSLCGNLAFQVHHTDYCMETLLGTDLSGLAPICEPCHDEVEVDEDGDKRTGAESQRKFRQMLASNRKRRRK
mgnify:CR=1 FL=1|jgi:hypothetical protein